GLFDAIGNLLGGLGL
uniref:Caeridin-3 n=1 Tax=Ranoidea gilleni TaxID=39405 RepID=CDN3_RANGI|nr:RecName: Full=Caeridin-3 [Ranoidea gilleni]prf//1911335C caeridin 3 [Ranoidea caerulea]prf//1924330B caeridin [Ranoidea gilleni]